MPVRNCGGDEDGGDQGQEIEDAVVDDVAVMLLAVHDLLAGVLVNLGVVQEGLHVCGALRVVEEDAGGVREFRIQLDPVEHRFQRADAAGEDTWGWGGCGRKERERYIRRNCKYTSIYSSLTRTCTPPLWGHDSAALDPRPGPQIGHSVYPRNPARIGSIETIESFGALYRTVLTNFTRERFVHQHFRVKSNSSNFSWPGTRCFKIN